MLATEGADEEKELDVVESTIEHGVWCGHVGVAQNLELVGLPQLDTCTVCASATTSSRRNRTRWTPSPARATTRGLPSSSGSLRLVSSCRILLLLPAHRTRTPTPHAPATTRVPPIHPQAPAGTYHRMYPRAGCATRCTPQAAPGRAQALPSPLRAPACCWWDASQP